MKETPGGEAGHGFANECEAGEVIVSDRERFVNGVAAKRANRDCVYLDAFVCYLG